MDRAALQSGRDPSKVVLLGAAKEQPPKLIAEACRRGLSHVGENFAQEALAKIPKVQKLLIDTDLPIPSWHFIGSLQRNKARLIVPLVSCVQSVDRQSLAKELNIRARNSKKVLDIMIQVNISREASKSGVLPNEVAALLSACANLHNLRTIGLMAIPAPEGNLELTRAPFRLLRELRDSLKNTPEGSDLEHLSMGMSNDFEVAIEEGATMVRVGTRLFGNRKEIK